MSLNKASSSVRRGRHQMQHRCQTSLLARERVAAWREYRHNCGHELAQNRIKSECRTAYIMSTWGNRDRNVGKRSAILNLHNICIAKLQNCSERAACEFDSGFRWCKNGQQLYFVMTVSPFYCPGSVYGKTYNRCKALLSSLTLNIKAYSLFDSNSLWK